MLQTVYLNDLLATLKVVETNTKGYHWTVSGSMFRSLHLLFDDIVETVREGADTVAETIVVLGGLPNRTLTSFVENSIVEEAVIIPSPLDMAAYIRDQLNEVLSYIEYGVKNKYVDPTTENDLLNITSKLRHWILFLNGITENWDAPMPYDKKEN